MKKNNATWTDEVRQELANGIAKTRKYSGFFDWPDKVLKEKGIAGDFVETYMLLTGRCLKVTGQGQDPPDVILTDDHGAAFALELTELVDQKLAQKGQHTTAPLFGLWPDGKIRNHIEGIVSKKDAKLGKVDLSRYSHCFLVLHTDEDDISPDRIRQIMTMPLETRNLDEAYILFSYDPHSGRYPLVRLPLTVVAR